MNFIEIFQKVSNEFDPEIAILVSIAHSINLSLKITNKDLIKNNYTNRLNAKTREILWEHPDKIDLVIQIREALPTLLIGQEMAGLGGCKQKTLKEIMEENT